MGTSIGQWRAEIGLFHASYNCCDFISINITNLIVALVLKLSVLILHLLLFLHCFIFESELANALPFYTVIICDFNFGKVNPFFCSSFLSRVKLLFYWISFNLLFNLSFNLFLSLLSLLLLLCGDIERNPGPKKDSWCNFPFCHWNLNSVTAHNFNKLISLEAYNTHHKFDVICLSETFLDSSWSSEDPALVLDGYKLVRADHPKDTKRGGVCIYFRESLPIRVLNLSYIDECLFLELSYENKKCFLISLYRSPSQSHEEFNQFLNRFEKLLNNIVNLNPYLILVTGDFNARSNTWWTGDINTVEGNQIESLTSLYGLHQIVSQPTHILENSASCIDLIFTNQPNMVLTSGVHPSLHPNCHHQIIYAKVNLKINYPPPYKRTVWDFKRADINSINKCICAFDWDKAFRGKDINTQIITFSETLLNIFSNYIPNKKIVCDDRDPPWINDNIKRKLIAKNIIYRTFIKNGRNNNDYMKFENIRQEISDLINTSKTNYYNKLGAQLNNPQTSSKKYWSILKTFFNGKKVPIIPPLLVNNQLVTDFKAKANLFNEYFSKQCTIIKTSSLLPDSNVPRTENVLSDFDFNENDILKIIRNLDSNKAHGHDNISIRMLKICDKSISKPLTILYKTSCLSEGVFPELWKKANIIPVHKKGDKQIINNYRPVSLLPICGKIFEKIMFNAIFKFLEVNSLLSSNQSGFRPNDSCVHQLISITHSIYSSFDCNPSLEVRGVFLDISKAFDRVWHDALLFKLRSNGINGNLYFLIKSFLSNRKQRVVLNGQSSEWANVSAGVPQGSILGPLFFLIYINDLSEGLQTNVKLFADDTSLFSVVHNKIDSANDLNSDLKKISKWAWKWKMSFNPDPTKQAQEIIFSRRFRKENHPNLIFNNNSVYRANSQKHLGLILDEKLTFNEHLKEKFGKVNKGLGLLRKLNSLLPRSSLLTIYKSFIRPHLDYCDVIYDQPSNDSFATRLNLFNITVLLPYLVQLRVHQERSCIMNLV